MTHLLTASTFDVFIDSPSFFSTAPESTQSVDGILEAQGTRSRRWHALKRLFESV
jgi:hypothetical protein